MQTENPYLPIIASWGTSAEGLRDDPKADRFYATSDGPAAMTLVVRASQPEALVSRRLPRSTPLSESGRYQDPDV